MKRTRDGLGISVRQAKVVDYNDELKMWECGVLGFDTPQKLVDTLLFLLGLHCTLRAGREHRNLITPDMPGSQFKFVTRDGQQILEYTEHIGLKNNKGGIRERAHKPKVVPIYPAEHRGRCPVRLMTLYLSKLPKNRRSTALYLRPKQTANASCWYVDRPIGINLLQSTVKRLCQSAGLEGFFTNHSLRASCATRMYNAGCDEMTITEFTGHRSLAVRSCKHTNEETKRKACATLSAPNMKKMCTE